MGDVSWALPAAAVLVLLALVAIVWFGASLMPAGGQGSRGRDSDTRRSDASDVWARPRDVRNLLVDHDPGDRLLLGHLASPKEAPGAKVATLPGESTLVLAPTGRGKSAYFVVPAVLRWDGPAVVTSTQIDVVELTATRRARDGRPVYVFDPLSSTDLGTCTWSPVSGSQDYSHALRAAQWVVDAARGRGAPGGNDEFWNGLGQDMLAPLLFAAAHRGAPIGQVVQWVLAGEDAEDEIQAILRDLVDADVAPLVDQPAGDPVTDAAMVKAQLAGRMNGADKARLALGHWKAHRAMDPKTKGAVVATARSVIRAFGHPDIAAALDPRRGGLEFDPADLLASGGTLYVIGPENAQEQFGPVFEAIINAVVREVETRYAADKQPIDPRLLLMLDEAGNIAPLQRLARIATAYRQKGLTLVSVWQDLAQLDLIYGDAGARVIANNHTNHVYLGGISDDRTLEHLSKLIGEHEVPRTSFSRDPQGRRSRSVSYDRVRVAEVGYLRMLPDGVSVVISGNSPSMRLRAAPYFKDAALRALIGDDTLARFDAMYGSSQRRVRTRAGSRG